MQYSGEMDKNLEISVIIPTVQAGGYLSKLLESLKRQTLRVTEIIVIDSSSTDDTVKLARDYGCRVEVIERHQFNHGRTRNQAADLSSGKILVFLTQDALPVDDSFIEKLTCPIREDKAAACDARQIPRADATPLEKFARSFNYPPQSNLRTLDNLPEKGIKNFFFSNVASAISRESWEVVGKFSPDLIMNEDMLLCVKLLFAGFCVAYQGDAKVYHSHNYTLRQQFRRYFDIGVFFRQARKQLEGISLGGVGFKFARSQISNLIGEGKWFWAIRACTEVMAKFLGVNLGKHHNLLPVGIKKTLSLHRSFWENR